MEKVAARLDAKNGACEPRFGIANSVAVNSIGTDSIGADGIGATSIDSLPWFALGAGAMCVGFDENFRLF